MPNCPKCGKPPSARAYCDDWACPELLSLRPIGEAHKNPVEDMKPIGTPHVSTGGRWQTSP